MDKCILQSRVAVNIYVFLIIVIYKCLKHRGDGVSTYQRAPPHLPKWPRRLTRAFSITSNPGHVLSRFLPRVKSTGYNLRPCAHVYELPKKNNRNFKSRVLYSDIY